MHRPENKKTAVTYIILLYYSHRTGVGCVRGSVKLFGNLSETKYDRMSNSNGHEIV